MIQSFCLEVITLVFIVITGCQLWDGCMVVGENGESGHGVLHVAFGREREVPHGTRDLSGVWTRIRRLRGAEAGLEQHVCTRT